MLRKLEESLRRALEEPFAQLFPDRLHPLEMAGALRREMEQSVRLTPQGSYAANRYTVALNFDDHTRLAAAIGSTERELEDHLRGYAVSQGFDPGPDLRVMVIPDERVTRGQMQTLAEFRPPPPGWLVVSRGGGETPRRYALGERTRLGRGADCDICLPDTAVSRHHATVAWFHVHYEVVDEGSANGVFVNDQRVTRAILADGDLLTVGFTQIRFQLS